MNLRKLFLTLNNCFKSNKKHIVKGIMVHSTGANNPTLKRYVGPDDGLLGKNQYGNHWNTPKPGGRQVCVHAFIGKLADGSIATYQTLPWDIVGWHSGSGRLGSAKNANNNGYIGFEICEDGLTDPVYFGKVYQEAVELCAYLCKQYNLDPTADGVIIGHYEGHQRGIASNHGDPKNWFPKHGKSMDTFRAAVKALVSTPTPTPTPKPTGEIKIGDIVEFTGNTHYTSASAKSGVRCKPGRAKVTAVYPKGTHPYHLIREGGGGSTVYGWVDTADIKRATVTPPVAPVKPAPVATIKVGSKVKVKSGARTYTGGGLASFVYKTVYDVQQIKGDRVVIGLKGQVTAAVKLSDLILQ